MKSLYQYLGAVFVCIFFLVCCNPVNNQPDEQTQDDSELPQTRSENGALYGLFSVSSDLQVRFSCGNLQYNADHGYWRFANHQYSIIVNGNTNISSTYDGWIDLFGWGTGNEPTKSSIEYQDYTVFTDWGINQISSDSNHVYKWRTLSADEWEYLIYERKNADLLHGLASVNNTTGYIILPDNWSIDNDTVFSSNANSWSVNKYSANEWQLLEDDGAVFLPCGGYRSGNKVYNIAKEGSYWSSTPSDVFDNSAFIFQFDDNGATIYNGAYSYRGRSVRMITESK